jgi:hypothetical protein
MTSLFASTNFTTPLVACTVTFRFTVEGRVLASVDEWLDVALFSGGDPALACARPNAGSAISNPATVVAMRRFLMALSSW